MSGIEIVCDGSRGGGRNDLPLLDIDLVGLRARFA